MTRFGSSDIEMYTATFTLRMPKAALLRFELVSSASVTRPAASTCIAICGKSIFSGTIAN